MLALITCCLVSAESSSRPGSSTTKLGYVEFCRLVRAATAAAQFVVRLQEGDLLVVDNTRVLHGRRAIQESSPRRLTRFWIT